MKSNLFDLLKALGLTLGGFLIGSLIVQGLKLLARLANIDVIYLIAIAIFSIVVYANYKLIKLSK